MAYQGLDINFDFASVNSTTQASRIVLGAMMVIGFAVISAIIIALLSTDARKAIYSYIRIPLPSIYTTPVPPESDKWAYGKLPPAGTIITSSGQIAQHQQDFDHPALKGSWALISNSPFYSVDTCPSFGSPKTYLIEPCDDSSYNYISDIDWALTQYDTSESQPYYLNVSKPALAGPEPNGIYTSEFNGNAGLDVSFDYVTNVADPYMHSYEGFVVDTGSDTQSVEDLYAALGF